jgi:hypothetical protein
MRALVDLMTLDAKGRLRAQASSNRARIVHSMLMGKTQRPWQLREMAGGPAPVQKKREMSAEERECIAGLFGDWKAGDNQEEVVQEACLALLELDDTYWNKERAAEAFLAMDREITEAAYGEEEMIRRERTRKAREAHAERRRERALVAELALMRGRLSKAEFTNAQLREEKERMLARMAELEKGLAEAELILRQVLASDEREREKKNLNFTSGDQRILDEFVDEWAELRRRPVTERAYSERMYELAYILRHHSPAAYKFLRQVLALPSLENITSESISKRWTTRRRLRLPMLRKWRGQFATIS